MIYGWIIGGLAALDLGVKSVVEGQEDDTFPRDLPSAKGFIKLHKNHNSGFPFGFMKERPELVKGIPLMVISAMAGALKEELKKWLNQLAADERKDPTRYHDSGMLFRLPNGLAVEPVLIRKKFLKWQDAHPEFPRIVFHGLRHSSATYQLMISGGDVKAVQGTTGHATADMLVNTYAHIQQSSRVELGKKFESGFYAKPDTPSPQAVPAAGEPTISMTALLELLKNADPEVKAQLRLALLT